MANVKITELPTTGSSILTDIIPAVQNGVTVQETLQQVLDSFEEVLYGYQSITSTANVTLTNQLNTKYDIALSAAANTVIFPVMNAATSLAIGQTVTITNTGSNTFSIVCQDGVTPIISSVIVGGSAIITVATVNSANGSFSVVYIDLADKQPLNAALTALSDLSPTSGFLVQTADAATFTKRSLAEGTPTISIANPSGLSGNPTISLVQENITEVGAVTAGAWQAAPIESEYGGTGVNNSHNISLGGYIATAGNFITLAAIGTPTLSIEYASDTLVRFPAIGTITLVTTLGTNSINATGSATTTIGNASATTTINYPTINNPAISAATITFPTSGGTPSTLDFYEEATVSITFSGAIPSTAVDVIFVRIGNIVNMIIPDVTANATTGTTISSTAIPARFRPATTLNFYPLIVNNTVQSLSTVQINSSTGVITTYATFAGGNFAGTGFTGFYQYSYTYQVA